MNTPKTAEEVKREMNDWAKAQGRFLDYDPWKIPRSAGSILDVPMTPEAEERIRHLDEVLARLEQQNAATPASPTASQAPDRSAPPVVSDSAGGPLVTNVPS